MINLVYCNLGLGSVLLVLNLLGIHVAHRLNDHNMSMKMPVEAGNSSSYHKGFKQTICSWKNFIGNENKGKRQNIYANILP